MKEVKKKGGVKSPYAICQASTGQSYATGKPIKSTGKAAKAKGKRKGK